MVHLSYFHGYKHLLILNTFFFQSKMTISEDSISGCSEELFKRGKGAASIYRIFCCKKKKSKSYCLSQQTSQVDDFSAFQCVGKFRDRFTEIIPLIYILTV